MKFIVERHQRLLEQIDTYESLIPSKNIQAHSVLSQIKKELRSLLSEIEAHDTQRPSNSDTPLSPRESEVLKLVAQGEPNKEIAYLLSISPKTVQFHIKSIFNKLEVHSRTEAAMRAHKLGILPI